MSKYLYRIFTIIDLHFGAMQPCSCGLRMTLEASDFSIRPKIGRLLYILFSVLVSCHAMDGPRPKLVRGTRCGAP